MMVRRLVVSSAPRGRGGLEAVVLALLGATGRAMTAGEVLQELGEPLAYTTVMTTLARLYTKGALTRDESGRAFTYQLAGSPADVDASVVARKMRAVLNAGHDRAGVLARFVADLSPADEQMLTALLANGRPPGQDA